MKRVVAFFLVLSFMLVCLSAPVSAGSEPFELRNGIVFGDSLGTVKQKENFPIEQNQEEKTNAVWFQGRMDNGHNAEIRYDFDENTGMLTDLLYAYEYSADINAIKSEYSMLVLDLIGKYGLPLDFSDGSVSIITGAAFEQAGFLIYIFTSSAGTGELLDYDEWIVPCDGYYVKIDLVSCAYGNGNAAECRYQNLASYHYFTDADYQSALHELEEEMKASVDAGNNKGEDATPEKADTGWQISDGKWYFFESNGLMVTGWRQIGESWYYFEDSGVMAVGWQPLGESWYYFDDSGIMLTGWQQIGESWYYFRETGAMMTGWFEDREAEKNLPADQKKELWYWFDENGQMATGLTEIDGKIEIFDESGLWLFTRNVQ